MTMKFANNAKTITEGVADNLVVYFARGLCYNLSNYFVL